MDNEPKNSEQIKAKFNEISTPFINQMSEKLITNLNDILKSTDTKFKMKQFEEKFRRDMIDKWSEEFDTMWQTKNIDDKLIALNELKQKFKPKSANDKAWRAHGHTAEQQTQLSRNRLMSIHSVNMQELLEKQTDELQKLIFAIEERRNYLNDTSKRRGKILDDVDSKAALLRKHLEECAET